MTTFAHTSQTTRIARRNAKRVTVGFVGAAAAVAVVGMISLYSVGQLKQAHVPAGMAADLTQQSELRREAGDLAGALAAGRKAAEIYRGLMWLGPVQNAPRLAASLHDLSGRLGEAGDSTGAVTAIQEAIELRWRLAKTNPTHAASLAQSRQVLARIVASGAPGVRTAENAVR
jgi:hypothetical protein